MLRRVVYHIHLAKVLFCWFKIKVQHNVFLRKTIKRLLIYFENKAIFKKAVGIIENNIING